MNTKYLEWLLNKCKYAVDNGSEEYIRERFIQLIGAVQKYIAEVNDNLNKHEYWTYAPDGEPRCPKCGYKVDNPDEINCCPGCGVEIRGGCQ